MIDAVLREPFAFMEKHCFNPFRESVVYRTGIKACLHDPKTVFNLISFMGYGEYVFCRVRKILKTRNENLIITIIRHIIDVSPDFSYMTCVA